MSREDRRKYEADVWYEAWRRGYDADRAAECAEDCYYAGRLPEQCVDGYASRARAEHERRELEAYERERWHDEERFRRQAEMAHSEAIDAAMSAPPGNETA